MQFLLQRDDMKHEESTTVIHEEPRGYFKTKITKTEHKIHGDT
jgi:hypothetical protein